MARLALLLLLFGAPLPLAGQEASKDDKADEKIRVAGKFNQAYLARNWKKAIEYGEKLARLEPEEEVVEYNLACVYALDGQKEKALGWLIRSAKHGFGNLSLFESDPDLESLHQEPGYRKSHEIVRKNYARYLEKIGTKADQSEPLILFPEGADRTVPRGVLVALHAYGGTPEAMASCWSEIAADCGLILVAPRAIHPVGQGYHWGATEDANMLVNRALEKVRARYPVADDRIVLTGFSQGASIAYYLGMRYPGRFRGVIPVAGEFRVLAFPENCCTECWPCFFIMVGGEDRYLESNRRAEKMLQEAGARVRLKVYPELGHCFPEEERKEFRQALAFVLSS